MQNDFIRAAAVSYAPDGAYAQVAEQFECYRYMLISERIGYRLY